jgi:hypothetical protein
VPIGYELLQDYDLPRVLGRGVDLTVATTRLIAGGILDRFPDQIAELKLATFSKASLLRFCE